MFKELNEIHNTHMESYEKTKSFEGMPEVLLSDIDRLDKEMYQAWQMSKLNISNNDDVGGKYSKAPISKLLECGDISSDIKGVKGFTLIQNQCNRNAMDLRTCVLLDSQSTVHAFCNSDLVTDVWEVPEVRTLMVVRLVPTSNVES